MGCERCSERWVVFVDAVESVLDVVWSTRCSTSIKDLHSTDSHSRRRTVSWTGTRRVLDTPSPGHAVSWTRRVLDTAHRVLDLDTPSPGHAESWTRRVLDTAHRVLDSPYRRSTALTRALVQRRTFTRLYQWRTEDFILWRHKFN